MVPGDRRVVELRTGNRKSQQPLCKPKPPRDISTLRHLVSGISCEQMVALSNAQTARWPGSASPPPPSPPSQGGEKLMPRSIFGRRPLLRSGTLTQKTPHRSQPPPCEGGARGGGDAQLRGRRHFPHPLLLAALFAAAAVAAGDGSIASRNAKECERQAAHRRVRSAAVLQPVRAASSRLSSWLLA